MEHKITGRQYNARNCFVCGLENTYGLKMKFFETESGEVIGTCFPSELHQSYPGRLHGGISCAILDEAIGRTVSLGREDTVWGITMELNLKYRRPVPCDMEIKVIARVDNDRGRIFEGSAEIVLPDGKIAVQAKGVYMKMSASDINPEADEMAEWGYVTDDTLPDIIKV